MEEENDMSAVAVLKLATPPAKAEPAAAKAVARQSSVANRLSPLPRGRDWGRAGHAMIIFAKWQK